MKRRSFEKTLFYFSILFWVLWGTHAWITWWIGGTGLIYQGVSIVLMAIAVLYQSQCNVNFRKSPSIIAMFLLYLLGLNIASFLGVMAVFGTIIKLYPLMVLASAPKDDQREILEYVSKGLAYILIPSLIVHFLLVLGVPFPTIPITRGGYYVNYILDLKAVYVYEYSFIPRFMSIFLEPGYLGILMAFMLFANRFEMNKWYNKVMLVSLIASFSLGGYVILLICYGLYLFVKKRLNIRTVIVSAIVLTGMLVAGKQINGGDNMFNNLIIERLTASDDEKMITGNNRFSLGTDYYYELYNDQLLFGLGSETVAQITSGGDYEDGITGAGYKVYFLNYGILSAICMLFFYIILGRAFSKYKRYTYCFLLILIITFVFQAEITSPSWYFVYLLGCACYLPEKSIEEQTTSYGTVS